jgi:hypothetical protein
MNAAGFVPTGLLILGFAASLSQLVPRTPLSILGSLLVGLFGVGIVSAGVFSCNLGCTGIGTSREAYLHIVASVVAFGSGVTACGVFGFAFRTLPAWRPLYAYSLISALVSALLLFEFNSATETQSLPGVWQRLFLGSLFSWCMVVGFFAFRVSAPGRRAKRADRSST